MSRILTLDIETSPHEAYAFNVWQTNILPTHIITATCMLTWSAKWHGEPAKATTFRMYEDDDFHGKLHDMLNDADVVVGYNHDKFDMRHINREFVERGFDPVRPSANVDMLKVVKQRFNFPHNRLDYVAQRILGESKLDTGGFELWPAFMNGDPKARKLMRKYNIQDVVLTEKLYTKLRPWIKNHPYTGESKPLGDEFNELPYQCPACQSYKTTLERPRLTRCFAIRLVHCDDCGNWSEGKRKKVS